MATKKKASGKKPAAENKETKPNAGNGGAPEGGGQAGAAAAGAALGAGAGAQQAQQARQLSILAQFVKDLSFESPNAPKSLQGPGENPKLHVNVNVHAIGQGEGMYEVDLNFEAKATSDSGVIYNIELVYAGLFRLTGIPQEMLQPVLFVDCPTILFPYLRRIVSDLSQEGGFPPLFLDPIDFVSLYRQNAGRVQQQQVQA
jgi:preprotein translocase subunit SecB